MKLLADTLKNQDGKYSSKRLTAFYCFTMATLVVIIDITCLLMQKDILIDKVYFETFLWFGTGVLGLNVASGISNKTINYKAKNGDNKPA